MQMNSHMGIWLCSLVWPNWGCTNAAKSTIGTGPERWTHLCCSLWLACKNCEMCDMWPCLTYASADCRPVAHTPKSYTCSEMSNWTLVTSLGSSSPFTGLMSLINLWEFCACQDFSLVCFACVWCFFHSEYNPTKLIWLVHNCRKINNWTRVGVLDTSFLQPLTSLRELWDEALHMLMTSS